MKWLTEDAVLVCKHELGVVKNKPSQELVTIEQRVVLVDNDPEGRSISRCPNIGATIKPCTTTKKVTVGYSDFIRINGQRVCLDSVTGLTNGTPPETVKYYVRKPGQELVEELA
jgi:hypothetical protein